MAVLEMLNMMTTRAMSCYCIGTIRDELLIVMGSEFTVVFLLLPSSWPSLFQESKVHCVLRLSTYLLETKHQAFAVSSHSWRGPCLTPTNPFRIDSLILNNNENAMKPFLLIPKDPSKHQFHPIICFLRTLVSPL